MTQVFISVAALLIGMGLMSVGHGLLGIILPLRLAEAGAGSLVVGTVMAGFFCGLAFGVYGGRFLISRVGHIRAFTAFMAVFAASILSHPFYLDGVFWFFLRVVQGICLAGLYLCTESWLNERATKSQRGEIMSLYMVTLYVGIIIGQLFVNVPDPSGFGLYALTAIIVSLAAVPLAATRTVPPPLPEFEPFSLTELYEISPLGIGGAAVAGVILGAFYGMAPFFAVKIGMDTAAASQFMAAAIFGGLLLQWPIGKLSDRYDRRTVIIVLSFVIGAISLCVIAMAMWSASGLVFIAPLFGGAVFTLYPLCVAHTNDHIEKSELVPASAGLILSYGIGAAAGPVAAAGVMNITGPHGLFGFIAAIGLALGFYGYWRSTQRAAPATEEQDSFQPVTRTTPLASELDPRGDPHTEFYPPSADESEKNIN